MTKAVIAAGGRGTRMWPVSPLINKHLIPVYDKPMIYYPLSIVMLAGIEDVAIVTSAEAAGPLEEVALRLRTLGMRASVLVQRTPRGVADALGTAKTWLDGEDCLFILGDNFLWGANLTGLVSQLRSTSRSGAVLAVTVEDPTPYAVLDFDATGHVAQIVEKPVSPPSNQVIPGIYYYHWAALTGLDQLQLSGRGEVEISDLNQWLLDSGELEVVKAPRGVTWLDLGDPSRLMEGALLVQVVQDRQGLMVGCLEEIALSNEWSSPERIVDLIGPVDSAYARYVLRMLEAHK